MSNNVREQAHKSFALMKSAMPVTPTPEIITLAKRLDDNWLHHSFNSKDGAIVLITIAKFRGWDDEFIDYMVDIVPDLTIPTELEQQAVFCMRDMAQEKMRAKGLLVFELHRGIFFPNLTRDDAKAIVSDAENGVSFAGKDVKPAAPWTESYKVAQDFSIGWMGVSYKSSGVGIVLSGKFTVNDVWLFHSFPVTGLHGAGDEFLVNNQTKYDQHRIVTVFHRPPSLVTKHYAGATRLYPKPIRHILTQDARYYEVGK